VRQVAGSAHNGARCFFYNTKDSLEQSASNLVQGFLIAKIACTRHAGMP
jgi:hypothetical protein